MSLDAQERVQPCEEDDREDQDRLRVGGPGLLGALVVVHADEPQEAALDRSQQATARCALRLVDPGHVDAERIAEDTEDDDVEDDLRDALRAHLETLPSQQRVDQVDEDADRDDQPEDVARGHQTRSSANRRTNAKAKHATAIARASMSAMQPGYGRAHEPGLKVWPPRLKMP